MKILLFGYYGHQNFGDDLLMKLSVEMLMEHSNASRIAVTSNRDGRDYIKRISPLIEKVEVRDNGLSFLKDYDRIVFGGGGTVFEYRENLGLGYYWRKRIADLKHYGLPKMKGSRFASIGLGIGPFADSRGESIAMNRLRYHDLVFTRDSPSYEFAKKHQLNEVHRSHDLCFLEADRISQAANASRENQISIIVRHYKYGSHRDSYLKATLDAGAHFQERGFDVRWMSFQPAYDAPVLKELKNIGQSAWEWNPSEMSFDDVYKILGKSRAIITARMHGTYLAGMLGVPTVSIALHPKLSLASNYFRNSVVISSSPNSEELVKSVNELLESKNTFQKSDLRTVEADLNFMQQRLSRWIGRY